MDGILLEIPGQADLQERIGTQVRLGDPLAIVGYPDNLRVEIQVSDRDIQDISESSIGSLATTADPASKCPIEVTKIIPTANPNPAGGGNTYTVIAVPSDPAQTSEFWRPNATGEVRLDVEPRSLARQWTHRLVDWVRLKLWI